MKHLILITLLVLTLCGQAWGATYTVGSGGTYVNFAAAFVAIDATADDIFQLVSSLSETVTIGADDDGTAGGQVTIDLNSNTLTGRITDGGTQTDYFTILGPGTVTSSSTNGISFTGGGTDITIDGVTVVDATNHGIWLEDITNAIVQNCTVSNSGNGGSSSDDNIHFEECTDFIAQYNTSYNPAQGSCIDASDSAGSNPVTGIIRRNTVYGSPSGHPALKTSGTHASSVVHLYYNVVYDSYNGVSVAEAVDTNIYNNVVYNCSFSGITGGTSGTLNIKNNIIDTCTRGVVFDTDPTSCDWNYFYNNTAYLARDDALNTYTNLTTWKAGSTYDDNSGETNPGYINASADDYRTWTCLTGTDVSLTLDRNINAVSTPCIGAYERIITFNGAF